MTSTTTENDKTQDIFYKILSDSKSRIQEYQTKLKKYIYILIRKIRYNRTLSTLQEHWHVNHTY